jgi:hypothetical protein
MNRPWADRDGLPTKHALTAATRVASLIDPAGSRVLDAHETYWHVATGGTLPPADLALGETLLLDCEFAQVVDGVLHRTTHLDELLAGGPDVMLVALLLAGVEVSHRSTGLPVRPAAVRSRVRDCVEDERFTTESIAAMLGRFDATYRTQVGDVGEFHVLQELRMELVDAGHEQLARTVRHVSRISDGYGYDIAAPRVHGPDRLIEVKSTTHIDKGNAVVFISRHEADVGSRHTNWALVLCEVLDVEGSLATTIGWLRYADIESALPADSDTARWESASIRLSINDLADGLPSAFL